MGGMTPKPRGESKTRLPHGLSTVSIHSSSMFRRTIRVEVIWGKNECKRKTSSPYFLRVFTYTNKTSCVPHRKVRLKIGAKIMFTVIILVYFRYKLSS